MNNSYNLVNLVETSFKPNDDFDSCYPEQSSAPANPEESAAETRIENMLLEHSKYHKYIEY